VRDSGVGDEVGAGVRVEAAPVEPVVTGRKLTVRLAIVNAGDRNVRLTYDAAQWIRGYGYAPVPARESSGEIVLGGYVTHGTSHPLFPGREICPDPALVFSLNPGERLVRDAQIWLEQAPAGKVELSMKVQLIEVTSDARCEKARLFEREARTTVCVQRQRREAHVHDGSECRRPRPKNEDRKAGMTKPR
jgi:hypothetical protein